MLSLYVVFFLNLPATTAIYTFCHTRTLLDVLPIYHDNFAIVANDGGLAAGTRLPSGLLLRDRVPQGHKVALQDLPAGSAVLRYGLPIGYALAAIPAGSWVHDRLLHMPEALALEGLPFAPADITPHPPLEAYPLARCRNPNATGCPGNTSDTTPTVPSVPRP